ncbi:hypothetical protein [Gymnodinialimonas sp. 57CJ19]|uniref:hypothetical protein n=1 Tax=Gymnodinialimonas sp. 57CJ19 TaxID=3138498 RepID=UPI00313433FF
MTTWEMRLNVYNNSLPGHANISFYEDGEHQYTIGANILHETTKLAFPQTLPFMPDDGIYRDESAYHLAELVADTVVWASVPLPEVTYDHLLNEARALENETYNYSLLTEACVDLAAEFYAQTGHPGEIGDLFAAEDRHGSLSWFRIPVSDSPELDLWPEDVPFYVPSEIIYVHKLEVSDPTDSGQLPSADEQMAPQKEWVLPDSELIDAPKPDADREDVFVADGSLKDEENDGVLVTLGPTEQKPDPLQPELEHSDPPSAMDTKDDPFQFDMKEDHFEFEAFDGIETKPEPNEYESQPTVVEHKSPPPPAVVETPKFEPEPTFVDPDYYGYF